MEHAARRVDIDGPTVLIRINRMFRYGMGADDLYAITRGVWQIGPRRNKARLAMAVHAGIIREVYEIASWQPAGTTPYARRDQTEAARAWPKRWEFVGGVASEPVRSRYLGGSVVHLFRKGNRNSLIGVNLG